MPWTRVNTTPVSDDVKNRVNQRLIVLDLMYRRILDNTNEPYSEATRIQLRSNARFLQGLARDIREDLGIDQPSSGY